MTQNPRGKLLITAVLLGAIAAGCYFFLNAPDRRDGAEKISDAINELPNGVDKAARQLEDRTPADKLSDAADDAGEDFKKTINQQ